MRTSVSILCRRSCVSRTACDVPGFSASFPPATFAAHLEAFDSGLLAPAPALPAEAALFPALFPLCSLPAMLARPEVPIPGGLKKGGRVGATLRYRRGVTPMQ